MENGNKPAFAISREMAEINTDHVEQYPTGLSKREYFAALAMQGAVANVNLFPSDVQQIAATCVRMADALLKELEVE